MNKNQSDLKFTIHGVSFRLVNYPEVVERDVEDCYATVYCCDLDKVIRLLMPNEMKSYQIPLRKAIEFLIAQGITCLDHMYTINE